MKRNKPILLILASLLLTLSVRAQVFVGSDVGANVGIPGSVTGTAPGVQTITGSGDDIWNAADNFYFVYTSVTGQVWEAKLRVQDLQGPDNWTKCELMVRVPDASGLPQGPDPFIAAMTTRAAGQNEIGPQYRATRGAGAGNNNFGFTGGIIRPSYPNTWLRLTRQGTVITMWYGTNGTTWNKYCDIDTVASVNGFGTPFPDPLLVGVAVTAHNNADIGTATVSDLSVVVTPTPANLSVVTQVQNASTYVGSDAHFRFAATNSAIANGSAVNYQWYKNDQLITNATAGNFSVFASPADNGAKVYCTASLPGTVLYSATGTVSVATSTEFPGNVKYQVYPNRNRINLNTGNYGPANRIASMPGFEAPFDWSNNYGSRLSGYFTPTTTGNYVFFICADDDADLWVSTDSSSANARVVAQQEGWAGRRNWITHGGGGGVFAISQRRSDTYTEDGGSTFPYAGGIPLTAGQKYFIMATHTEGGGGDNLGVLAKLSSDPDPLDGDPSNLTNGVVTMLSWTPTNLSITTQPVNTQVFEGLDTTLRVRVSTDAEVTPVYQWQRNLADMPGATSPDLFFSPANLADNGAKYRCIITLPPTSLSVTSAEVTLTVNASVFVTGIVKQEIWGPNNNTFTRAAVTNGTAGPPTSSALITIFDTPDFANDYVQKLSTWFVPAVTGDYVFLLSSDDDSDLFVSTDDDPANKRLVAQQTGWNANREWSSAAGQRRSDQFSPDGGLTIPYAAGINMIAGQQYYIEGVHHEGGGGDNFSAYVILNTEVAPANGTPSNLTGQRVGVKLPAATSLTITAQPQSVVTHGWDPAVFNIAATTDALYPPTYQWRRGGQNIPNATGQVYSFVTGAGDNGAVIDCVVTLSQFGSVTSAPAAVTVLGDAIFQAGTVKEEYFAGVGFQALLDGSVGAPTQTATWTSFESLTNITDDFARRVSGLFIPPTTGSYVFFIASDDQCNFYVNTNGNQPQGKVLVCQQTIWNGARLWNTGNDITQRRSDQWSPDGFSVPFFSGIPLVAGTQYYIEALYREGSGGDNLAVTYKLYNDPDPLDGDAPLLTGNVIGHMAAPAPAVGPTLSITRVGNNVQVSWSPTGGTLQTRTSLTSGTWTDAGTANPASIPITGSEIYFRVRTP